MNDLESLQSMNKSYDLLTKIIERNKKLLESKTISNEQSKKISEANKLLNEIEDAALYTNKLEKWKLKKV